jgi:hypothetical protein
MDYGEILKALREERERLQRAITTLEDMLPNATPTAPLHHKRGRKSMSTEERQVVAARMRAYWKKRKERVQQ